MVLVDRMHEKLPKGKSWTAAAAECCTEGEKGLRQESRADGKKEKAWTATTAARKRAARKEAKEAQCFFFDTFWKAGLLFSNASWITGLFILEKTFDNCKLWKIKGRARTACPGTWVATGRLQTRARQPERCAEAETSWKTSLPKTLFTHLNFLKVRLCVRSRPKLCGLQNHHCQKEGLPIQKEIYVFCLDLFFDACRRPSCLLDLYSKLPVPKLPLHLHPS